MRDLTDKFSGALLGTHVGDALGMPVEGSSPLSIRKLYGQLREMLDARLGRGTYTDDTEMMIALAESLVRKKGFDGEDLAHSFLDNFDFQRGYGAGTRRALELIRSGIDWREAGAKVFQGGSYGNGSAMRIAPVGCLYFHDLEQVINVAFESSLITHAHPLGKEGAALQASAVALALKSDPEKQLDPEPFLAALREQLSADSPFQEKLQSISELIKKEEPDVEEVAEELGNDSRALCSAPPAIYSFLRYSDDFEEALVFAVGLGGDTDTIAAMAGAIAGAYKGKSAIPARWLNALERGKKGADYIEELAFELLKLHNEIAPAR